jgi:DNA-binding NarL/FixJ family response regulator
MEKIKVLVVDDHAIMRDGIRALLGVHDDIEIAGEAFEGREALDKVQELNPDVVVMDVAMPGMDGLEATRRITKRNPKIKVLVLSQYDDKKYVLAAVRAGASGYVSKRALGTELVLAIRAVYQGDSYLYPSAAKVVIEDLLSRSETDSYDKLTAREREILKLIADGHSSREIAEMLYISLKTVLGHRANLMTKLDLHNRTELIKYALREGLVSIEK